MSAPVGPDELGEDAPMIDLQALAMAFAGAADALRQTAWLFREGRHEEAFEALRFANAARDLAQRELEKVKTP